MTKPAAAVAGMLAGSKRVLRRAGGTVIRRAGLLPGGMPDGLGEDDALLGTSLPHTVMVFFPDPPTSLYQLEQWYIPLRELDKRHRVVVILADSRTAKAVRRDSGLDAIVVARYPTMDDLVARSNIKAALYVNYTPDNGQNLRFTSMVHIHLLHGDSDKSVTVSHQTRGYDFLLMGGQAAIDRMAAYTMFYDVREQCIAIGRPQVDSWRDWAGPRDRESGVPLTMLYAPTWEGADPSATYGSLLTLGQQIVGQFLADGWRVIYRPHPLTGVRGDPAHRAADRAIRQQLDSAGAGRGRVDALVGLEESFRAADLLVCDVSAIAVDFLAVDRPLMITAPGAAGTERAATAAPSRSALTDAVPRVTSENVTAVARMAREQVDDDASKAARREVADYYLTGVRAGDATGRFLRAIDDLIDVRDQEMTRLSAQRMQGR